MSLIVYFLFILNSFESDFKFFENSEHKNHEEIFSNYEIPFKLNLGQKKIKHINISQGRGSKIVLGYLPYWELGYGFKYIELIDIVAYFAVEIDGYGNYKSTHGWTKMDIGGELVDFVHAHNKKIIVTITNFSASDHELMLKNQENFNNAISKIVDAVVLMGADGVNIDFEGLPYSVKEDFVAFIKTLNEKLKSINPNYHLSLAMPKVDWKGSYDYDMLAINSDGLMIMAYGYHYKYGNPGPMCPLYSSSKWGKYSLDWTVNDYFKYGGEENRQKFIIGLPFYGYDWTTTSDKVPGTKLSGTSGALTRYTKFLQLISQYGKLWDEESLSPYIIYKKNGEFHQVFAEDSQSLKEKFKYILKKDLGGIGIWTLGYEECNPDECGYEWNGDEVWKEIEWFKASENPNPDTVDSDTFEEKDVYEINTFDKEVFESDIKYGDYLAKDTVQSPETEEKNDLSKKDFKPFCDSLNCLETSSCCSKEVQQNSKCKNKKDYEECSCDSGCSFVKCYNKKLSFFYLYVWIALILVIFFLKKIEKRKH